MLRLHGDKSVNEIVSSLSYIFPVESHKKIDTSALSVYSDKGANKKHLNWDANSGTLQAIFYSHVNRNIPELGIQIMVLQTPSEIDIHFGNIFCRVFNEDVNMLPDAQKYLSQWISCRQSQFRRAIATFTSFSTEPMIKWIQTVENSTSLTYEGKPFSYCLFMTKQRRWIKEPLKKEFLEFSQNIGFERAILNEKWIRALDGDKISLVGLGLSGKIIGMFSIPKNYNDNGDISLSPHEDIESIIKTLVNGTCVFKTTKQGDIFFMLPNNTTFLKTQGRWYYLNYTNILNILSEFLDLKIATSILRLILNLSFDRHGAMISVPDKNEYAKKMIPDFNKSDKANRDLRNSIKGLSIIDSIQRSLISSTAKIDGALVISKKGKILDAACMISEPSIEQLEKKGINKLERFSGARTTAAWNASIYGLAIKVSEDGPISIFNNGQLISKVG